jgi:phosphatidylserine/phosphatidylglycerophosphate/cardiolipin synthase-like enzyme
MTALTKQDLPAMEEQIAKSPVLSADAALLQDVKTLFEALTVRFTSPPDNPESEIAADATIKATDALLLLHLTQVVKKVREEHAKIGLMATPKDWFDIDKWTHHKLLLVDGEVLHGGGRNLEDEYHWEWDHPLRLEDPKAKYVFMDVDFYTKSAALGAAALKTFNKYLAPACYNEPPLPAACESGIPMAKEVAANPADAEAEYAKIVKEAAAFAALHAAGKDSGSYVPVHKNPLDESQKNKFTQANVRIAYAENRMFPGNDPSKTLLAEEPSQHNAALVAIIDSLKSGEEAVFQNAYLYFPAGIQLALVRAMKRGVSVVVQSNSPESSDLGFVAQAARLQYRSFLKLAETTPGKVFLYEYLTQESLHAKVEILGSRYLVIGSINADPRCEFLDTNNGVIIDSPELVTKYKAWLKDLRDDLLTVRKRPIRADEQAKFTDDSGKPLTETPLLRQVTSARLAVEDAKPTTDKTILFTRKLRPFAEKTFEDSEEGAKARAQLQAMFISY